MSIFAGRVGRASSTPRSIRSRETANIKTALPPSPPSNAKLDFEDNMLSLSWDSRHPVTKLEISQPNTVPENKQVFLFSNYKNYFELNPRLFANFDENQKTQVKIYEAKSSTGSAAGRNSEFSAPTTLDFTAIRRDFDSSNSALSLSPLPWIVRPGATIILQGVSRSPLRNKVYLQSPTLSFDKPELQTGLPADLFAANQAFRLPITLKEEGTYILEVNHKDGYALLNRPIYVYNDGVLPLIPDFEFRVPQ